MLHVRLNVCSA